MAFNARFIANIIEYSVQRGARRAELLDGLGYDMEALNDEHLRLEAPFYNQVIEKAVTQTKDPYLGLHLGDSLSLSGAGLVVQITQAAGTVAEAVDHLVSFSNLGCESLPFHIEKQGDEVALAVSPDALWQQQSPLAVRHTIEAVLLFTCRQFRTLTRKKHPPLRITFAYDQPEPLAEYERLFPAKVAFRQPFNALMLDPAWMEEPVVTSDYNLLRILVNYAEQQLQLRQETNGFFPLVRQTVLQLLRPEFPTIEQVAGNMNMSVRTLQRRLKEEGHTYKTLLDELRRQLALDYLENPALSIKEIGYLLDYSDTSAFVRSFRRWTGASPGQYRELEGKSQQ